MKNKDHELTVLEASKILGVTTRSVINYIKSKEIEAIKVGRSWYIKRPSFDAFTGRYNFTTNENSPLKQDKKYSIKNLRAFKLTKEFLDDSEVQDIINGSDLKDKILSNFYDAMSHLGAGYYAYHFRDKVRLYSTSREKLGAALALIYFSTEEVICSNKVTTQIEDVLLPAYSALIKKLDMKYEKNKNL